MDLNKDNYWVAFHGINHVGEDGFLTGGSLGRSTGYSGWSEAHMKYSRTVTRVYVQDFDNVENMLFNYINFVIEWDS